MILDTPFTDALARLQRAPLGNALYVREQADDGRWETVWLVRDEARRWVSPGPAAVEFRAAAFDEGGVVVLPILLRLGREDPGSVYETCMNAYQIEGENVYLQDLARQNHIRIHLFDDAGQLVHSLMAPNGLQELAIAVLARRADYQPSTTAAFEYARERLYANYADMQALWQALEPHRAPGDPEGNHPR
jgi:hypothetical protein